MNYNHVTIAGRLTRDPESRHTPSGTVVVNMSLAVNDHHKGSAEKPAQAASFFDIIAFGKVAETLVSHARKGTGLFVDGKLQLDQWTDKATGQKRSKVVIICNHFQFTGPKPADAGEQEQQSQSTSTISKEGVPF